MSEVTELSTANKQKLVSDMKVVVADAEEILRATAGVAGEKMGDLRERIGERLRDAKLRLADAEAAKRAIEADIGNLLGESTLARLKSDLDKITKLGK